MLKKETGVVRRARQWLVAKARTVIFHVKRGWDENGKGSGTNPPSLRGLTYSIFVPIILFKYNFLYF